jgi:hypothetical protein
MLGIFSRTGTDRRAIRTIGAIGASLSWFAAAALGGTALILGSRDWAFAGIYPLAPAVCLTLWLTQANKAKLVDAVAVENYLLGRSHRIAEETDAQVVPMKTRRS